MCYTVPIAAAIVTGFAWRKNRSISLWWLLLLFCGASLFGVIDHLWNGELFLISENWVKDLALGAVITAVTSLAWGLVLVLAKNNPNFVIYPRLSTDLK